ncbi:alkyl hydroperoxide reductase/ Thiol specific antioxidant/ Mal allergen [Paenibacillus curdlanolyticus YK9]|uniref:thioredoxin-dependent peroxiredoxin n=1 Tax=Paenibacillus curdlanolyticus YK9 TaxID=717606 RepID=E0I9L0_9BACL|nr:peroxiredoxin-like family protein [Paenibacillus curdlanolyticus]EFM11094.1 alkyl hydroperoxide reductase/ Thiol specific antioxidant/ Mal allergen [Paenibacillus curdlanolyticus YK9]
MLNQTLEEAKNQFVAKAPQDVQTEIFRLIREQQQSGIQYGLPEGSKAVDFTLNYANGSAIDLFEQLAKGPVVLTFYRGGWCPFCNIQLRAYQNILPEIEALNGQLIAISPQNPTNSLAQQTKESIQFPVLSDKDGAVAASYNVLFQVPSYLQEVMSSKLKLNLGEYNGTDRWILPIPSTFVIDQSGIIRWANVNPDFMRRSEPQDIISQLKLL